METGGTNKSGIHWDMLYNMKDDGEIYWRRADYKDGKFMKWNLYDSMNSM